MSTSKGTQKPASANYSFFKVLKKSFKKTLAGGNDTRKPPPVMATAVGGSAQQPVLINELKTADNHKKLEIILKLKESVENHSISSILETWIPARQILFQIDNDANSYSNYDKLRKAVIDLLYTCIEYDDLNQLSILVRYISDLFYFCQVTPTYLDPNIKSFLKCFYKLVDSKLLDELRGLSFNFAKEMGGDTFSIFSSEGSFLNRNMELMGSRSIAQFVIDILSCDVLIQTNENVQVLGEFVNKLCVLLRDDRSHIFDNNVLALTIKSLVRLALITPDFEDSHLLINEIFNFINTALGYAFLPVSTFSRILALLFYFYNQGEKYSIIIGGIFRSLIRSENCCQLTFLVMTELIETCNFEDHLTFDQSMKPSNDIDDDDTQIVSYKDMFTKTFAELNGENTERLSSSKRVVEPSGLEKYFPLISKSLARGHKIEKQPKDLNSVEFGYYVLSGLLRLMKSYISENNFELLQEKDKFIFDPSSYKFQALINALYAKISGLNSSENTTDVLSAVESKAGSEKVKNSENLESLKQTSIATNKTILSFISFLIQDSLFKEIPEYLFFYESRTDTLSIDSKNVSLDVSNLSSDSIDNVSGLELQEESSSYSILDILDLIYTTTIDVREDLTSIYPNLFKDGRSYSQNLEKLIELHGEQQIALILTESELHFFELIHIYRDIINKLQSYSKDLRYSTQLETADLSEFFFSKTDLLTSDNWSIFLKSFEKGSRYMSEDHLEFATIIKSLKSNLFCPPLNSRAYLYRVDDVKSFDEVKLLMLKTIQNMIDFHFDFYGDNEKLWSLVLCLFGIGEGQDPFLKSENDPQIVNFLLKALGNSLIVSKHKYFEILLVENLFHDIVNWKRVDTKQDPDTDDEKVDNAADVNGIMPLDNLSQLVTLLITLFIKSSVTIDDKERCLDYKSTDGYEISDGAQIKDSGKKAKTIFDLLLDIFKFIADFFTRNCDDKAFLESAEGSKLFEILFVILDCFSRLRATESGYIYFDATKREYNILIEQQSSNKSTGFSDKHKQLVSKIIFLSEKLDFIPKDLLIKISDSVKIKGTAKNDETDVTEIDINEYFNVVLDIIQGSAGITMMIFIWYSCILQLSNIPLYRNSANYIRNVRKKACEQLTIRTINGKTIEKEDKVLLQMTLVRLLPRVVVHSALFSPDEQHQVVHVLVNCLDNFENIGVLCIHTLPACCYQIPWSMKRYIQPILWRLQQHISNADATPHILEFLLSLSHMTDITSNFSVDDYKPIFAMAFRFIQTSNEQHSIATKYDEDLKEEKASAESKKLASYFSALSYNVISGWFLKLKMKTRKQLAPFIIKCLLDLNHEGGKDVESACIILIEFIQRFTYTNLDLRFQLIKEKLDHGDTSISISRWIFGISIISIMTHKVTGKSIVTVRRPTGTTKFELAPDPAMVPLQNLVEFADTNDGLFTESYIFLQLLAHIFSDIERAPILIPDQTEFRRSIELFDKKPLINMYKAGLIYIGPGQSNEQEILLNTVGSKEYHDFLSNIGELISLKNNTTFYTGGLNADIDGEYAYCWDDKVSQLLFHTTTLMPSKNSDSWMIKKSHIGNDFINIFFDESGKPFNFNLIRSEFTFINIVITPVSLKTEDYSSPYEDDSVTEVGDDDDGESANMEDGLLFGADGSTEKFFQVRTYLKPGLPKIFSTCRLKTISLKQLPVFVRNIALITNQFAQIWNSRDYSVENNWSDRYHEIMKIKQRVQKYYEESKNEEAAKRSKKAAENMSFFSSFSQPPQKSTESTTGEEDTKEKLLSVLDFTSYS
ncbi:hypothetical protein DASC09_037540 [Saccharomycopsis crataegensis]|uniref:Rap-GAP domain-containing protein n=1 Tax=Saccharomycopsis crataegensis TaxID=43959 RepID=A0AAV5QNV5_9ASCO|nr:hypothetical protein DASC09_037540 [Saccharomycopsis crataegensis]